MTSANGKDANKGTTPPPFVSVCIFTYNCERYLKESIGSALAQDFPSLEVLVVDDGSTDNTPKLLSSISDPRFRYILKEHSGRPESRNVCVHEARGRFILWLGADDVLLPGVISKYVALLKEYPDVDIAYGDLAFCEENLSVYKVTKHRDMYKHKAEMPTAMLFKFMLPDPGTMIKKELYNKHGLYCLSYQRGQDYHWYSRVAGIANFKHCGEKVVLYRYPSSKQLGNKPRPAARVVQELLQKYPVEHFLANSEWRDLPQTTGEAYFRLNLAVRFLKLHAPDKALQQLGMVLKHHPSGPINDMATELIDKIRQASKKDN